MLSSSPTLRLGQAATVRPDEIGPRPEQALVFYGYEGCPMCGRVREAVTRLALTVEVRPCPRGGVRYRPEATALSGKSQFPYLVDPNTDVALLESADIVRYLYDTYGTGAPPAELFGFGFAARQMLGSLPWMRADGDLAWVRLRLEELEQPYLWEPGPAELRASGRVLRDVSSMLRHLERARSAASGASVPAVG